MPSRKFSEDIVQEVLQRRLKDEAAVAEIVRELQQAEARAAAEEEAGKAEPIEREFLILLAAGASPETGWVLQVPANLPPAMVETKIREAIEAYNLTPTGRRHPAETVGQGLEVAGPRFFRPFEIRVKTRLPVIALPLRSNELEGEGGREREEDRPRRPAGRGGRGLSKDDLKRLR